MRACERAGTADRVQIIWQYILFEWNDSDEELAEARRRAADIGVPLKWVFTHSEGASKRYTAGSEAAARLYAGETAGRSLWQWGCLQCLECGDARGATAAR